MINFHEIATEFTDTCVQQIDLNESFMDLASGFASMPGTTLLMSGGDLDCSRYHILGVKPWLSFIGRARRMTISSNGKTTDFEADPFDTLRMILKEYHTESPLTSLPFTSGLMGYLAYDLKDHIEVLPRTSIDDLGLPSICLFAPSIILIHDKKDETTWLCASKATLSGFDSPSAFINDLKNFQKTPSFPRKKIIQNDWDLKPNMTRQEYVSSIKKIKRYITAGDVYQVNFAQRFETEFSGDPFDLFKDFYQENPAPFFAYINAGDHQIISTSPERFIHQRGSDVETRPIKGTRPRGRNKTEDQALKTELQQSLKDEAELSMIVDLMRNDLGKVCERDSVIVSQHKRVEEYQNVFHMISIIKGRLASKHDSVDLIRATFPGGSITGCPKIRAMEIIDELEPNRRHVYTGSIGYLSFHDTMDLSIAIRTAVVYNKKTFFSVGGGIVFDSKPSEEYDETLHKGKTLIKVKKGGKKNTHNKMAWINGAIRPVDQAQIRISDLGYQYGYGFFETIRFARGVPCYLKEHINRFNSSWKELFQIEYPDLSWGEIINQVIDANMLKHTVSSIKIIASWGSRNEPPYDYKVIVTARPYTHRLSGKDADGLRLATYPYPRQTPLADYKTLNYAYYYLAGKWAKENGADEAIIMNPDRSISETNSANLLVINGNKVTRPSSIHCLPGIMEGKTLELLSSWGYKIEKKCMRHENLFTADNVIMTNSLIGAVPVISVDNNVIKNSIDICKEINDMLL